MMVILFWILAILLLIALLWIFSLRCQRKTTDFYGLKQYHYAHRGLHGKGIPENSLAAFSLAVERGYGAELDVHLSKDGRLVVMHDESLQRTAGVDKNIADCTAADLAELRLEHTNERIPYLEEVLPLFEGKTPLIIELKPFRKNHAALSKAVCDLIDRYPKLQFCVESFDPRVLYWLKKHRPNIVRGQLSANFRRDRNGLSAITADLLTNLFANFLTVPNFVAYKFEDRRQLSLLICKKLWGVQEVSWTIRSNDDAKTALADDSIIIFEHFEPTKE